MPWRPSPNKGARTPMADEHETVEAAARLLQEQLEKTVSIDGLVAESLPAAVERLRRELRAVTGRKLGSVLFDPRTPLTVLESVKDYAKKLAARATTEPERDAISAIYFAAIASALAFHRQKISAHSYDKLRLCFGILMAKQWMPSELDELFGKASRVCEQSNPK